MNWSVDIPHCLKEMLIQLTERVMIVLMIEQRNNSCFAELEWKCCIDFHRRKLYRVLRKVHTTAPLLHVWNIQCIRLRKV